MLSRLLRQLLFVLIHIVVGILVAGQNVYHRFWNKLRVSSRDEVTKSDIRMLLQCVPRFSKKLKHLVVIADTDLHPLCELARVVIWSLIAGIPYVSFHDITGSLKENEEKFFLEVERKKKGIPGCIKWSNKPDLNGYSNGTRAHTVIVHILTADDGRPKIVQCIQDIVQEKIQCNRESTEFTVQEFQDALDMVYPTMPDPEIAMYTGRLCSTYGLLPWQIRLTEFIQLSLDHSIHINDFVGALHKYNKCDQRYGK